MCRPDDFPPYCEASRARDDLGRWTGELDFTHAPRDTYRESRTAHAVRSAGRPRRVVYIEGPDELAPPEPCPECGVGDAEYLPHEPGCPSGFPTW